MKRIFSIILLCTLLLSGCSLLRRPHNLSSEGYNLGMSILSITDKYLRGESTAALTAGQIQGQSAQLGTAQIFEWQEDEILKDACNMLYLSLMEASNEGDSADNDAIIHARNYLAEILGEADWNG